MKIVQASGYVAGIIFSLAIVTIISIPREASGVALNATGGQDITKLPCGYSSMKFRSDPCPAACGALSQHVFVCGKSNGKKTMSMDTQGGHPCGSQAAGCSSLSEDASTSACKESD